jgi:hypothetical protein
MRQEGRVARIGDVKMLRKVWIERLKVGDHLQDVNANGRIHLK